MTGRVHGHRPAAAPRRGTAVPGQRVHPEHRPHHPGDAGPVRADREAPPAGRPVPAGAAAAGAIEGQTHYLIIDDVDQIPDGPAVSGLYVGPAAVSPLLGLLAEAGDLGAAGHRHRQGQRVGARGDDRAAVAPPQRSAGDYRDVVGQSRRRWQAARACASAGCRRAGRCCSATAKQPTYVQLVNPLVPEGVSPASTNGKEYS